MYLMTVVKLKRNPPKSYKWLGMIPLKHGYWKIELLSNDTPLWEFYNNYLITREDWIEKYMEKLRSFLAENAEHFSVIGAESRNRVKISFINAGLKLTGCINTPVPFNPKINYFYLVLIKNALYDNIYSSVQYINLKDYKMTLPVNIEYVRTQGSGKPDSILEFKSTVPFSNGWISFPTLSSILDKYASAKKLVTKRNGSYVEVKPEFIKYYAMSFATFIEDKSKLFYVLPGLTPILEIVKEDGVLRDVKITFDKQVIFESVMRNLVHNDFNLGISFSRSVINYMANLKKPVIRHRLTLTDIEVSSYVKSLFIPHKNIG